MKQPTVLHRLVQALGTAYAGRPEVGARPGTSSFYSVASRSLLIAALLPFWAASPAQAAGERPRPENFANYSLYIQALVDYQRAQELEAKAAPKKSSAAKLCRDEQGEGGSAKKKSSCEGKYLLVEDLIPDDNERASPEDDLDPTAIGNGRGESGSGDGTDPYAAGSADANAAGDSPFSAGSEDGSYESVEDVIARVGYRESGLTDSGSPEQRPMFNGIPLNEIPVQDLSDSGIEGLLGLFDNARIKGLSGGSGSGSIPGLGSGVGSGIVRGNSDGSDGSISALLENYQITFYQPGLINLDAFTLLTNGYTIANIDVTVPGPDSVAIDLNSETRMQLWIVDRDGLPGTDFAGAGAVEINHLGVLIPRLEINIQGIRAANGDGLMQINAFSPQPIYVDLRNTEIGVADAVRDGSVIGDSTPFLVFGPQSILTVAPGTSVRARIGEPSGMSKPFVTLDGYVGDISVDDIRLLDNNSGGRVRIGRVGVRGLNFVDTKVYLDEQRVTLDAGRGITNLGFDIERLSIGDDTSRSIIGDFYARGGHIQSLRMTAEPH
jgi:hypothetical protein